MYQRVVSLVPSVTESLFELGLGARVAGITDYCVHPADRLVGLPRLGGTKNVRVPEIIALTPDLVIANQEENSRADVEALQAARVPVWVTFPRTVREALDLLWDLIRRFDIPQQGPRLLALEKSYEWTEAGLASDSPTGVFCPIWRGPETGAATWWMTIHGDTYVSDVIRVCGGLNVFAGRERRYPLAADLDPDHASLADSAGRDQRYPRVTLDEILAARPDVILLPGEPFAFDEADVDFWMQFSDLPAVQNQRVHLLDGSLLTWHGTRLARALQELPALLAPMAEP
jgi:ABC-type Fe3+-hydroxamate transport system substrate-binding protein